MSPLGLGAGGFLSSSGEGRLPHQVLGVGEVKGKVTKVPHLECSEPHGHLLLILLPGTHPDKHCAICTLMVVNENPHQAIE